MRKIFYYIIRDVSKFLRSLSPREQFWFAIVWVLIVLRVVFPIKHMDNGYVLYLHPFQEQEMCLIRAANCEVDISRTFAAVGTLGLTALGIGYLKRRGSRR